MTKFINNTIENLNTALLTIIPHSWFFKHPKPYPDVPVCLILRINMTYLASGCSLLMKISDAKISFFHPLHIEVLVNKITCEQFYTLKLDVYIFFYVMYLYLIILSNILNLISDIATIISF